MTRTVVHRACYLGALAALCLLAACELFGEDATCPDEIGADEANYFPLAVGDVWTFDYEEGEFSTSGSVRTIGTLRWEVTAGGACQGGRRPYTIRETFDGRRQVMRPGPSEWEDLEPRAWTEERQVALGERDVDLGGYASEPVPYVYPAGTPDSVSVGQGADQRAEVLGCARGSSGGPCSVTIRLARNVGLVSRSVFDQISVGRVGRSRLTRLDD